MAPRAGAAVATLAIGIGFGATLFADANRGSDRERVSLVVYRTRPAANAAFGGHSYANVHGADLRDFAIVTETRRLSLRRGVNVVTIAGLPTTLEPSTVSLRSATDPEGTHLIEQRFQHDVVNGERLLERARGHEVSIRTEAGSTVGTLVHHDSNQVTVRTEDPKFPLKMIQRRGILDLQLGASATLVATPTLTWKLRAATAGTHTMKLSYRAHGVSWTAAYTAIYDPSSERVELSASATLRNRTGHRLEADAVVLVHRTMNVQNLGYGPVATIDTRGTATRVVPLPRPVRARDGDSVRIDLFPTLVRRKAKSVLIFESSPASGPTSYPTTECYATLTTPPDKTSHRALEIDVTGATLPTSLPPGVARVFTRSAGALTLVSEQHVSAHDRRALRIRVGNAEALTGRRKQISCQHNEQTRELRETIEVTIENRSSRRERVVAREFMNRWSNWVIESESSPGTRSRNSQEYRFELAPKAKKTLRYVVVYNW